MKPTSRLEENPGPSVYISLEAAGAFLGKKGGKETEDEKKTAKSRGERGKCRKSYIRTSKVEKARKFSKGLRKTQLATIDEDQERSRSPKEAETAPSESKKETE